MWRADVRGDPPSAVDGSCSFPRWGNVYGDCHSPCTEQSKRLSLVSLWELDHDFLKKIIKLAYDIDTLG